MDAHSPELRTGRCEPIRASLEECFTNQDIAINELLEVNPRNMEKEGKHIDAALPPIEPDMPSCTLYMANHYGIIQITSLNILR